MSNRKAKSIEKYLSKQVDWKARIKTPPPPDLGLIVTIPCHNEPDVLSSVQSLLDATPCSKSWEVIILINASETATDAVKNQNEQSYKELKELAADYNNIHPILINDLPAKHAGVGLARKLAIDEATSRFYQVGMYDGVIACYDADSLCSQNYLQELEDFFEKNDIVAASIHYEHPLSGTEFNEAIYQRITQYELHLRYYVHMQKWCGLPYAHQTVGSSMAVDVGAYAAIGGMNKRKAGEDFYFMHKLIKYGLVGALTEAMVIPSPRISDRVPFGTGRAIGQMTESNEQLYYSYDPSSFKDIRLLVDHLPDIYTSVKLPAELHAHSSIFFEKMGMESTVKKVKATSSSYSVFERKFYQWFDAFMLMKYLHFVRDQGNEDIPVVEATISSPLEIEGDNAKEMLEYFRSLDKTVADQ